MKYTELDGKGEKELQGLLAEERTRLHAHRMRRSVNQLKDVREIREIRQRIAWIMTKLSGLKVKN
jgi:ribosomal protein L29